MNLRLVSQCACNTKVIADMNSNPADVYENYSDEI